MPGIKHQFTGGKMNKDLDERLVPNGGYRDAMNIQVSISEGSDVGTVQNLLGNSLVPGQNFISENAVCVGSIADEKDDKLYYFITQKELLSNGNFDKLGDGWYFTPGASAADIRWSFTGNQATGLDGTYSNPYIISDVPGIVEGKIYRITYDIVVASSSGGVILANHTTVASTLNSSSTDNNVNLIEENKVGTHSIDWLQGPSNTGIIKLYNHGAYNGTIDNISIKETGNFIVEYDSNTNTITPVFVDTTGDVLKLNPDNMITGINIVDDLLFWTDNESEPKKINIQRSIEGTDSSGIVHTKLINESQGIDISSNINVEEGDITVIKKGPKLPIGLNFTSAAEREDRVYAGIIETTNGLTNSSFILNVTKDETLFNFSNVTKDDIIQMEIPEDVEGNNNFSLDWKVGDSVVFKEFPSTGGTPSTPLSTWVGKGLITPWVGNNFTDPATSLLQNGSFAFNSNNWAFNTTTIPGSTYLPFAIDYGWWYRSTSQTMHFQSNAIAGGYHKLWQSPANHTFLEGEDYKLTYDLDHTPAITLGGLTLFPQANLQGNIMARIVINGKNYDFDWQNTVGTHEQTITLSNGVTNYQNLFYSNQLYFQTGGNQTTNGELSNVVLQRIDGPNAQVQIKIEDIELNPPTPSNTNSASGSLKYVVDKFDERPNLFKDKLVRFSYRYTYKDGEHSPFAPFSNVAFLPGNFDYHPKKGHNIGMTNQLMQLELLGFVSSDLPREVVEIDILAKVENSTSVYIVDTIRPDDKALLSETNNPWNLNKYTITTDTVKGIVPSNQLLRPWDNVPKRALSQEISGNRLIYGNYTQGHTLLTNAGTPYRAEFNIDVDSVQGDLHNKKSIKSLRDYQLGIVFSDEHGRETPVLSNQSASFHIGKDRADKNNIINVSFLENEYPVDMKYFKFFIKETSSEYYNIAMDRYYIDDDSNIWLSFPSSDRNKIELDTTLILKKGAESDVLIGEEASYKVIAIENEAPDFIKTSKLKIEEKSHVYATENLFGNSLTDAPLKGDDSFKMNYSPFAASSGDSLHKIDDGDLYVEFGLLGTSKISERYRIAKISCDVDQEGMALNDANYSIKLDIVLGDDVDFITNDPEVGLNPTKIVDHTSITIYKYVVDKKATFEGRFFAKIFGDEVFKQKIQAEGLAVDTKYRVVGSKKLYFMKPDHTITHDGDITGHNSGYGNGAYQTDRLDRPYALNPFIDFPEIGGSLPLLPDGSHRYTWNPYPHNWNKFSCFAVFFRNYKYESDDYLLSKDDGSGIVNNEPVGQYKFGALHDNDWEDEFLQYTSSGGDDWVGGWVNDEDLTVSPKIYAIPTANKTADERRKDDEVWFIDNGPHVSYRGTNDNLHWQYCPHAGDRNRSGIQQHTNSWTMDIAMGGISGTSTGGTNADFFGIPTNDNYDDDATVKFVEKLNPGIKFRFKEDPSGAVYPFEPATTRSRLLRYASNHRYGWSAANYDNGDPTNTGGGPSFQTHEIPHLSPNFTNNWYLRIDGQVGWNPAGALGFIDNGLELVATITAVLPNWFGAGTNIEIDSNVVQDPIYGTRTITPGLIMTSYNNAELPMPNQELLIERVEETGTGTWVVALCGYRQVSTPGDFPGFTSTAFAVGETVTFRQPTMNGYSNNSTNRINTNHAFYSIEDPGLKAVGYTIEFVEAIITEPDMPDNPAVFETEPKEQASLDVYYEASGFNSIILDSTTINNVLPIGSLITSDLDANAIYSITGTNSYIPAGTTITEHINGNTFKTSNLIPVATSQTSTIPYSWGPGISISKGLKITRPNASTIYVSVQSVVNNGSDETNEISINAELWKERIYIDWHNCYSFGNGVESNRIKDLFNQQYISNGVKVSTTLNTEYKEENRSGGLIYSGIYNSNGNTNNLNQFIAAEKITKDINPIYGSIQKLHSRDSDLVTLCEDKCLRILVQKDALYNADGNPQLLAKEGVLGQAIPFGGEFGISKNPESFASESYRAYFTDKVRGVVMRLSKDGLTPISNHGMKDWFRDNLSLGITNLLGENNLDSQDNWDINPTTANSAVINGEAILGYYNSDIHDSRYGRAAYFRMNNILEIGKRYRLQYDVIEHSELGNRSITVNNTPQYGSWEGAAHAPIESRTDGAHVNKEWVANRTDFELLQYQVNSPSGQYTPPSGAPLHGVDFSLDPAYATGSGSVRDYVRAARIADGWPDVNSDGIPDNNDYPSSSWLYGGTVRIKNLIVEEVKEPLKIIGSYDDRQDEYNVTIHGTDSKTVSFKEDVKGWVSFKSFTPENAISCANDYFTMQGGKLWQHHNPGVKRNTFYGEFANSSVNVLLNDSPGSVKSFHTLDYEGSQSRVEGIRSAVVKDITDVADAGQTSNRYAYFDADLFEQMIKPNWLYSNSYDGLYVDVVIKQYRNNILIFEGNIRAWDLDNINSSVSMNWIHLRKNPYSETQPGDWEVGDIITTQLQEDSVNYFNITPKDGWYVSGIETDKQEGNIHEFIEKEGKWFNYIKGRDFDITSETDFAASNIQGIGILSSVIPTPPPTAPPPPSPTGPGQPTGPPPS